MTIVGYLRKKNGDMEMAADYYCGRYLGRVECSVFMENNKRIGQHVTLHKGFGKHETYVIADMDEQSALLISIS